MDNAVKYAGAHGQVTVETLREGKSVAVTIFNTGVAIAPEHIPHLFERFYRADSARSQETGGFGLGLAIAAAIVKAHNGQICASSQPNMGTTVKVTFPIAENPYNKLIHVHQSERR